MELKKIFKKFEANAAYAFATIDGDYPETRMAHFLTYDEDGLYFQTMKVKPFYRQLKETGKLAVCSLTTIPGAATHDERGLPIFAPGYHIRVSGDVRELDMEELRAKADKDAKFLPLLNDIERYPTMTTFVLHRFKGEVYDYDFGKEKRDHKLERERFSFREMKQEPSGFVIDQDKCIACGVCAKVCTFSAIVPGGKYSINGTRCDECGSCYSVCPVKAITPKCEMNEEDRKATGTKVLAYMTGTR